MITIPQLGGVDTKAFILTKIMNVTFEKKLYLWKRTLPLWCTYTTHIRLVAESGLFSAADTYESSKEDYFDQSVLEATAAEGICCTCHKSIAYL